MNNILLTIIFTIITTVSMAQFSSKSTEYRYASPYGSTVRVFKDRTSYETINFQCKQVLEAEWSGDAVLVTILTQSGNKEIWRCTSVTERRLLRRY